MVEQVRYALGDSGYSYVVGYGKKYPRQPQEQAASCQPAPATCNQVGFISRHQHAALLLLCFRISTSA